MSDKGGETVVVPGMSKADSAVSGVSAASANSAAEALLEDHGAVGATSQSQT